MLLFVRVHISVHLYNLDHGVEGCWIDPPWGTYWVLLLFQSVQCKWWTKGCAVYFPVCAMMHDANPCGTILDANQKYYLIKCELWLSSHYLSGPYLYVWHHIAIKHNVLSALLNKTFPSFLPFFQNKQCKLNRIKQ